MSIFSVNKVFDTAMVTILRCPCFLWRKCTFSQEFHILGTCQKNIEKIMEDSDPTLQS